MRPDRHDLKRHQTQARSESAPATMHSRGYQSPCLTPFDRRLLTRKLQKQRPRCREDIVRAVANFGRFTPPQQHSVRHHLSSHPAPVCTTELLPISITNITGTPLSPSKESRRGFRTGRAATHTSQCQRTSDETAEEINHINAQLVSDLQRQEELTQMHSKMAAEIFLFDWEEKTKPVDTHQRSADTHAKHQTRELGRSRRSSMSNISYTPWTDGARSEIDSRLARRGENNTAAEVTLPGVIHKGRNSPSMWAGKTAGKALHLDTSSKHASKGRKSTGIISRGMVTKNYSLTEKRYSSTFTSNMFVEPWSTSGL